MLFKLERPWTEWIISTKIKKKTFEAKIDTGAFVTLIGKDIIHIDDSLVEEVPKEYRR